MFPEIIGLLKKVWCFLRFVWRSDFFGEPIDVVTAWEVAVILTEESIWESIT